MFVFRVLLTAFFTWVVSSCTSTDKSFQAAEVLERIGGKDEAPAWADVEQPMFEEAGNVVFVSTMTMAGNSRPEACGKAAELDAKAAMLRHIKDNITASGQLNEVSADSDLGFESLTAFLSQGSVQGAKTQERYWEKRVESDADGERVLRLKCAVKVAVKKSELARQLREATGGSGNKEVRERLIQAQKDFIDGLSKQTVPAH